MTNQKHTLGVFVKKKKKREIKRKTTMYVQYACKCCRPGVATVHPIPPRTQDPEPAGKLKRTRS